MPRYAIILTPLNDAVPAVQRLRALLKRALRSHAMRCVEVRELPDDDPPAPGPAPRATPAPARTPSRGCTGARADTGAGA